MPEIVFFLVMLGVPGFAYGDLLFLALKGCFIKQILGLFGVLRVLFLRFLDFLGFLLLRVWLKGF